MAVFAIGALIGGIDYLLGNKWGFGEKFEEAIELMAPTAFNMVGIICLTPTITILLRLVIAPVFHFLGIDPGMVGGVLALDMGGYPLAMELADQKALGAYSGILVGSVFGCTLVFVIPFGMGVIKKEVQNDFLQGVIIGLIAMPVGLIAGGLVQGLEVLELFYQTLPVLLCSVLLIVGLLKIPDQMIAFFQKVTGGLKCLIKFGLVAAAVCYLLGIETEYISPITDGMNTVVNITIVLLGSLPFARLLQILLKKPLEILGKKIGLQEHACVAFMIALVSSVPVFVMLEEMDRKNRIVVTAFVIDAAAILGAHLAYTAANAPTMTGPLLVCKCFAGVAGVIVALFYEVCQEHP